MREHPILFSTEMVKAILDGRKTQTRRVMEPQPQPFRGGVYRNNVAIHPAPYIDSYCSEKKTDKNPRGMSNLWCWWTEDNRQGPDVGRCRYGKPGDLLWVRETWSKSEPCVLGSKEQPTIWYKANNNRPTWAETIWRPSIHMPRWASRITLEVTGVRVEQLQDISEEDAIAEGIGTAAPRNSRQYELGIGTERIVFANLWDSINAKRGYGWDVNPWVWVVEFKAVQ